MTTFRKHALVLGLAFGVAGLAAGTPPAHAAGEKGEAKQACEDLMQDKGYKHADADTAKRTGDDKVRVEADAKKHGDSKSVDCVYNSDTDKARIKK